MDKVELSDVETIEHYHYETITDKDLNIFNKCSSRCDSHLTISNFCSNLNGSSGYGVINKTYTASGKSFSFGAELAL